MDLSIKLDKSFTTVFNKLKSEWGSTISFLNGFEEKQLSYTDFIDNFIDKNSVSDASIDGNANVGQKDIVTLLNEMSKPHLKLLAFNKIFYEMNKKYGHKISCQWLENEWDGHFYLHDAFSSTTLPYCYAYDLEELVNRGLYFIDNFNAEPPKHLVTYTDFVGEFVSWNCNRSSGAVGLPSFLVYSFYFWKKDCDNWYFTGTKEKYRDQEFQRIIYKLNQPYLRSGIQSAFTNFSIFDRPYFESLFGAKTYPDGSSIIDYEDEFMEYQKAFMTVVSQIRSKNLMTFPVLTCSLLRVDGKFSDEDTARWCCRHNMQWADSNFFISSDISVLSNCCRLLSNIKDLGYFNSIGGTALEVGSVKVNTINLARIAYESNSKEEYLEKLKEKVVLCCQCLDVIRGIIQRNVEKKLLTNYSKSIMSMESQYSTIGIIGVYETLQKFELVRKDEFNNSFYKEEGLQFAKEILETITNVKNNFASDKTYSINVEQIPGERAAAILMQKDKFFFPKETYELPLYGNQWIPLGVKTTMQEKIRISSILDKACSGG